MGLLTAPVGFSIGSYYLTAYEVTLLNICEFIHRLIVGSPQRNEVRGKQPVCLPDYRCNVRFRWGTERTLTDTVADGGHESHETVGRYVFRYPNPTQTSNLFLYIQLNLGGGAHEARRTYRRQGQASSCWEQRDPALASTVFALDLDHLHFLGLSQAFCSCLAWTSLGSIGRVDNSTVNLHADTKLRSCARKVWRSEPAFSITACTYLSESGGMYIYLSPLLLIACPRIHIRL